MLVANRSAGCNVHIYNVRDPNMTLGGLILINDVINANFYSMVGMLGIFDSIYFLQDESETVIQRDN